VTINGKSYILLLGFTISGSSIIPMLLIFWAFFFAKKKPNLLAFFSIYLTSALLFICLSNFTEVIIYSILVLILFIASTVNVKIIYKTISISFGVLLCFGCIFWFTSKESIKIRFLSFLNPEDYPDEGGYMYIVIKDLLLSGGWLGNKNPPSYQISLTTDLAFANITYYFGWIVSAILIILLALFIYRIIFLTTQIKDRFGKQLTLGVCSLLSIQFIYNVGMLLGAFPIISVKLPLISYGFNITMLNSILIGIVLSVNRRKNLVGNL